jgi:GTP-binding protein
LNKVKIINAQFIKSAQSTKDSMSQDMSEIVFIGRSNVGKSSLLNSLTNNNSLAKKSSTPGKTQLINFFEAQFQLEDDQRYPIRLVDLPGFGYAKVSKEIKKSWHKNLTEFLVDRFSIRVYVQLIDSRHLDLEIDKNVTEFLESIKNPDQTILKVFTKSDKLKQKDKSKILKLYPNAILISNTKKSGIDKLQNIIFTKVFL